MDVQRSNPYPVYVQGRCIGYQWYDETGDPHPKLYKNAKDAIIDMLKHATYLDEGPTRWDRLCAFFKMLWKDESTRR